MKLHLPKGLRSAVLACMAVVGGFATTVGTGVIAGGAITIAFSTPQAYADYSWKGGTGDKTAADWNTADNWELNGAAWNSANGGNGPGTPNSNMWAAINVGADARVTFGSADSRVGLEGWNLNLNLEKLATLYATTSKFQGTTVISVNNDSHLYLKHNNGHFDASTINIGANSSVTLQITADKDNGAMTLNLNDATSKMTFTADTAYTLRGAVNVKSVALSSVEQGTWGTKDLGLTLHNVTLNNLNIDLGEGWTRSSVEITEDNYVMFGGMYSIIVEDGVYKLAYSTAAALTACEWTGGDLSWGVGSAFTGATTFANGAEVSFTTANANVTLTSNVLTKHLSVAENVEVGISGEYKVTALDVAVASGAKLGLSTVGNALGTVDLSAGGTLVLSPGKEATLAEVIGADTVINGGTLTISGAGTNITSTGNKLAGVVVNVDGGTLTFNEAFQNLLQKDVTISNGGKIKVTVDGSGAVNDLCAWTTNQNISILSGGEMDLGTTRFSFGGSDKMILNNGTLSGAGSLEGGAHAGVTLHLFGSVEMEASNGSVLAANARIQSGNTLTINTTADGVDAPALTISGAKDAGFLKNEGTLKKVGTGTLVISTSCTDSAGVIVAEAGTLAIKGAGTSAKNITVLDGATLELDGAVTLSGTNHLAGVLSMADTVTLNGALTLGDTAEIDLSDWVGGDTYQLFNLGEGASITPALVKVAGLGGAWMLNIDGALVESADLHWLGGDFTWNADTKFKGGKLIPTSAVTFDGDAGDVKATVEGALVTTILSVEDGTNLILSGEGTLASTETYVEGEMTVGTTGNSFGTVEIGSDGTLTIGAAGNNMSSVEMEADASLVIATGGTTTLAGSIGTTNITGGTLGVATGTTLEVADGSLNNQKMDIAGELVISGCSLRADINISGKLTLNQGDGINYGANNTITVDGGELALGANRQTFGANNKLVLHDGTVTGTGDQHGAVDFYQDGGKITSTGTSSIEAPVRLRGSGQTTTMDVQDGTLTVSSVCHTGGGSYGNLSKIGAGTLAISGSLDTTGAVKINEGVLKMLNGSSATSAITLAGGSLAAEGTATMASLAGSGDITVAADGTLTITNVSCDSFTKKGAGTLAIGTLTGNFVSMNHEGTQTVGTYALDENAVLSYGKTGNLLKIDALTTAVAVDIFGIDISSGVELNLGIASSVSKDLISVIGLENYEIVDDNGYWKLTSADTELATDWDFNWGSKGLAGSPQTITEVAIAADQTAVAIGGVASITGGSANTLVYGGAIDGPFTGNSWIMAKAGTYNAIVGGNYANNWGGGTRADFNGNSHILVDGATVGYIIGGNYKDGQSAQFNGSSFISVFSGDVTGSIIGSGVVAHDSSAVHTGDTNIFIYTALNTNNANLPSGDNMGNLPKDMVIGGFAWGCNVSKGQTINGNTNITLDLTGYTGSATTFGKHLVGGSFNGQENSTQTITGSTNVTVNLGTLAMANGVKVVGGNWVNNGPSNIGATNVTLKGGTYNGAIAGGSWVNGGNKTHTIGSTNVTIEGGTFESFVAGGTSLNVVSTAKTGAATMKLTGGIYKNVVTAGNYVGAEGSVSNQGDSTLTVSGGTFNGNVAGASYLGKRATSTSGTSTVTIADAAFTGWVTGGVFTNSSSSVVSIGDVNMSLTDSSFSKLVAGGTFVGGNSTTNTIGDVNIVLDGVTLSNGLYGGVYHYGEGATSTSTVGDVTITLTGDGTISGNIWAAGGINGNNANITVASTTVKVADTVAFADGVTLNAGFDKAATDSCVVAVTGDRSLIFTGNADQDRSTLAFAGFNKIGVETAGKTATIGALTATEAITIDGKGTIKLGGAATLTGGATVEGALDMNGQSVTGDVTVKGTLTSKGTSVAGTLTIDDAATLTDATAATNIVVDSYSNTKGLTATEAITVGTKLTSSAALTAGKITGEGSVEITGGTVTLSDTTDAFANTGTTSIAGATLAGTWTADDVTIGAGVTASGEKITLANSTINSTITTTGSGSVALSGDVTVGVAGVNGDSYYTHNGATSASGNGFYSGSTDYTLVTGASDVTGVSSWLIGGAATDATKTTYANGTLTVKTDADLKTYWVNTGTVSYNGTAATYNGTAQSLDATTKSIKLHGGTLQLATNSVAAGYISASDKGGTLDVDDQSITQAVFGTLEGTVALIGTGSYDLGTRVTALATNVALGTGWTGTVKMSDVTLGNDAYSAFAKTNLEVTTATISNQLVMNGGSLTLGGAITADMAGLADVTTTTISWSTGTTGTEGTGFSLTSRAVQLVDVDGTVSVAAGTTWYAMDGTSAIFDTTSGVLSVTDKSWTTVYNIKAGDTVDYTATDDKFINANDVAATAIRMNGSTLNLNSELADNLLDGGIEVNGTGNTISINATELSKGSLSVQDSAAVKLTGNGIYDLSSDSTLGTGVSLATGTTGWTGKVQITGATVSDFDIDTLANGANSTVEISGVTGSLAADAVDAKVAMAGKLTINGETTTTFNSAVTGTGALDMAADSALTFAGTTAGWNGDITHTGTGASSITYTGTTTIANSITNASTGTLALNIGGSADVIVTGDVDVTDLTIDRATTFNGSLAVSDTLTNNASLILTQDLTLAGQLVGEGSLEGTNLVLQGAAANEVGKLTLTGALTMGTADVASKLTCVGTLTAASIQVNNLANVLQSKTLGGTSMNFLVSEDLLANVVGTELKTATLLTLTTSDAVDATAFSAMLKLNGNAFETAFNSSTGQYQYTLLWDADTKSIIVKAALNGVKWADENGNRWNASDNPADYKGGDIPDSGFETTPTASSSVVFGDVDSDAGGVLVNGTVYAKNLTVDRWSTAANNLVFRGADDTVAAMEDKVIISDDMSVSGRNPVIIGGGLGADGGEAIGFEVGGVLKVHDGAALMVAGNASMEAGTLDVRGNYGNLGDTVVNGNASVAKNAYLYNGAAVLLGQTVPASGDAHMEISGDLTNAGTLVSYPNGTLNVSGATVNTGEMLVHGGEVTIGTEAVESELNNADGTISIGTQAGTIAAEATEGALKVYGDISSNEGGTIAVNNGGLDVTGSLESGNGELTIGTTGEGATAGTVSVGGEVNNEGGTIAVNNGSLIVGTESAPADLSSAGGTLTIGTADTTGIVTVNGTVDNSAKGSITVDGGSSLTVGGEVNNEGGKIAVNNGSLIVGNESAPADLSSAGGTLTIGSADTAGIVTVTGGVDNSTGGSIAVDNGSLTVGGAVDNQGGSIAVNNGSLTVGTESAPADLNSTGGTITVGTADSAGTLAVSGDVNISSGSLTLAGEGTTANIGGDLTVTDNNSLTVGTDTTLTVGGDMKADNVTLAFGGDVTVGGNVEIGTLTNDGVFTANGSEDTLVHIDTLANNGTLSVGKEVDGTLAGGHLDIGSLSGEGDVNVGTGGSLTIDSATTFTGQLNNLGTLYITSTTLDSAQLDAEQTAGDITTESLTISDNATGFEGGSYKLGNVATDTLVIDGTSSMDAGSTRLSMESLAAKTADGKVAIVLSDVEEMVRGTGDVTDSSYHLITTAPAADGTEAAPFLAGSITEKLDLSRYGYDENGEYDATKASVQSDYMQHLLQQNKYVVFSDSDPLAGTATLDVASGTSDLYAAITELSEELSVWNLDGAHDMTEAGLTVLKGGKLVSDDILDNVQKVVVTGEQSLELTGKQELDSALDLSHVTLNNLTAGEGTPAILSITGDSSATDSATITTAADGFAGTLALSKVSADITGKVDTIEVGADLKAMLNVSDADINLGSRDATFGGDLKGGSINFGVGSTELGVSVMKGDLTVGGTAINVQQTDSAIVIGGVGLGDEKTVIADLDSTNGSAAVTLIGKGYDKYFQNARLEGGKVVADRNDSYATDTIKPSTENGAAGAELLDNLLVEINPQAESPDSQMAALLNAVDAGSMSDETAAALAGSSISALGLALSGDVERQLRSIRNRTTTMGVNECVVNEGMPYFNAWFNTESNRTKLDADSTNPGYTLDSWGGTVGFDVDVNPNFTMGLAISAMYGSITAEGPDSLDGDMDTYYLSLFARYADCAWTHTFVATLGKMDGSYSRTIPGWGKTDASIDGTSFGLMYEVGYVIPLDEDGEACVQPIFNVMLRHSSVGSFTEDGDLGLDVDKQGMTTLTFGLGARLQAVVGESVYNRASIFEGRILAKADLGDRQSEADVAFVNGGSHKATVKSAELGTIGLELGAGLTIPLGDDDGSLFFDASVELRSGYTDVNGTVGYRINF